MFARRFIRDDTGVALLEFALLSMLILLMLFGTIDFGRAFFTANNLTSAAREGARYGARLDTPCQQKSAIRDTAATKISPFGNDPVNAAQQVVVTCLPNDATVQSVQVQINYPFRWLTGLDKLMLNLGSPLRDTLHVRATFRWEGA